MSNDVKTDSVKYTSDNTMLYLYMKVIISVIILLYIAYIFVLHTERNQEEYVHDVCETKLFYMRT